MAGCGWWWQNHGFSWVIMGGGNEIMIGRGWSWVVVGGGDEIMAGRRWSCIVARFSNASI